VRSEASRKKSDKAYIAQQAGVPPEYQDDVWISIQSDMVNIYFGGVGAPNGPGHGHYVMDGSTGEVTYARDPFDDHGAHNFTDYEEQQEQRSTWEPRASQPPDVGIIDGTPGGLEHMVSFKTGGPTGDQTLIADGDYSDDRKSFTGTSRDRGHNHYGSKAEAEPDWPEEDKWIEEDRGKYSGPDH
jgi:hypothetical protein